MLSRKLTVIQMLPDLESGGVERGTLELGTFLSKAGHRSIVVSSGGRLVDELEQNGSRHVSLPVGEKNLRCLPAVLKVRRLIAETRADILHLRSRMPAWVGLLAVKSLPRALRPHVVTTFHGIYSINKYSAVMTKGEKVIAISRFVAEHIRSRYRVPESRITTIPRGVDETFAPERVETARMDALKAEWGLIGDPVIMLPGRITELKGHDVFIRSLSRLRDLPWTALCVGDIGTKQRYHEALVTLAKDHGVGDRVRFVGNCADMPAAFMLADIAVSSSSEPEAFGRTSVEAMAMGLPVVATAHGGSLETVLPGKTGWLVPPGDPEGMAMALAAALTKPELREEMGRAGATWVRENFTTQGMCEKTLAVYEACVGGI